MRFTRREIFPLLAAAAAQPLHSAAQPAPRIHIGAQTNAWPIDPASLDSFLGVLRQARSIGYEGFETCWFNVIRHADRAKETRERIASTGLVFWGLHVSLPGLKPDPGTLIPPSDAYRAIATNAIALGARHLVISGQAAPSTDAARRKAAALITAARYGEGIGLPILYHNHEGEFARQGEEMNILFDQTEGTPVRFLLDAGHAFRGGADIVAVLQRRLPRIAAFHMRDFVGRREVPLGHGSFPLTQFAAVLRQRRWSGWALNEEDNDGGPKLGNAVIEPAYHALAAALGQV
jgi:sugar phosphate isomerase/epimerase